MYSTALIQLTLQTLACSQKTLAAKLGVSTSQISKWKNGEHMSSEMEERLRQLAQIGDSDPEVVQWTGSVDNARKWLRLVSYLAELATEAAETGYNTAPLQEDMDILCWHTLLTLREMGVELPQPFPPALDFNYKDIDRSAGENDEEWETLHATLFDSTLVDLIYRMFCSLNDVYGFYAAYLSELMATEELDLLSTAAGNIESGLLALAASKLEDVPEIARNFAEFRYQTYREFESWLYIVKQRAFQAGLPLRAEIMDLVYCSHGELGHDAEAESLGFNKHRLHPDIYMNELLTGMRVIHQVLPKILEKLEIDFELDTSDFYPRHATARPADDTNED